MRCSSSFVSSTQNCAILFVSCTGCLADKSCDAIVGDKSSQKMQKKCPMSIRRIAALVTSATSRQQACRQEQFGKWWTRSFTAEGALAMPTSRQSWFGHRFQSTSALSKVYNGGQIANQASFNSRTVGFVLDAPLTFLVHHLVPCRSTS